MAKSFSNSVALNFISSAQQKEAQAEATENKTTAAKSAKPAKEENKTAAKAETPKKVKEPKTTAKTVKTETSAKTQKLVKPAKPAKAEKVTPQTPDLPMLNLNIPVVERKSTRVQLLIKPSLVEKLKAIAKTKNTSVNDLVNVILETVLK